MAAPCHGLELFSKQATDPFQQTFKEAAGDGLHVVIGQFAGGGRFQLIKKLLGLLQSYLFAILLRDGQDLFRGLNPPPPAFSAFPRSSLFLLLKMYLKRASRRFLISCSVSLYVPAGQKG